MHLKNDDETNQTTVCLRNFRLATCLTMARTTLRHTPLRFFRERCLFVPSVRAVPLSAHQTIYLGAYLCKVGESKIDGCKADVRDLVKLCELVQNKITDLIAGYLSPT